jgi:hypothetical protein
MANLKKKKVIGNILSPEDKLYLRRVGRYLQSMGMDDGNIEFDFDYEFDWNDFDWDYITHFSNNYAAEIPEGLIEILKKIFKYIGTNDLDLGPNVNEGDMLSQRVDVDIDVNEKVIVVSNWWSYYDRGDSSSKYWGGEDGKEIFEEWEQNGLFEDLEIPNDGLLTIKYNGSGDSGYIESSFDEIGDQVPAPMEDWCYNQLERNYGGWEINEGSDGEFVFNFHTMEIELTHTYNVEETATNTIYEEKFGN